MRLARVGVAVAVVGLVAGGCGWLSSGVSEPPAVADAREVDMCTILTEDELRELGIELESREQVDRHGLLGCRWRGEPFTLRLEKDERTVAEYLAHRDAPNFTSFREQAVNGRNGVQFSVTLSRRDCVQLMEGGSVSIALEVAQASPLGPAIDPCAEALRIAQMIEPRLP